MKHIILAAALCAASPVSAFEIDNGGNVPTYANRIMSYHGVKRLDGYYHSSAALWLGNPGACIASHDTVIILHPVTSRAGPSAVTRDSPWNGIIPPTTSFDLNGNSYASTLSRTPWGRRVYQTAAARGCFSNPAPCNFGADELVAMGVPKCGL